MPFTRSITSLMADFYGNPRAEFLAITPEEWADRQMAARYGIGWNSSDADGDFPSQVRNVLIDERKALETWFDEEGKLNPTLQSAYMVQKLAGPLGDGLGWDFRPDGQPETRMLVFKGTLLAAWRSANLIQPSDRHRGNMQFGGLATIVRSAYTERAALHSWRGVAEYNGADMSRRWVAHMTFIFLLRLGSEREWAWDVSKCGKVFGPVDERLELFR